MAGNDESSEIDIQASYATWKKNTPYLYDCIISHTLTWPSLTVQWFPYENNGSNKNTQLLLGTNTSQTEQEYLLFANVFFEVLNKK